MQDVQRREDIIEEVTEAIRNLASRRVGALIVLEREVVEDVGERAELAVVVGGERDSSGDYMVARFIEGTPPPPPDVPDRRAA